MPDDVQIINPTLPENISTVVALAHAKYGDSSGRLAPYDVYTLTSFEGQQEYFALTHAVLQFVADPRLIQHPHKIRINIVEPTIEAQGARGRILPVIKSIIFKENVPVFDESGSYVVKEIAVDQKELPDKPNKPNASIRIANREHNLASQMPLLGAHYGLLKREHSFYLHMNRARGFPLNAYLNKLNEEQFLLLACALLEEVPKQLDAIRYKGEHVTHCDLKPNNIMGEFKNDTWFVTVIDMGLAKGLRQGKYNSKTRHGNLMVLDRQMLFAYENKEIITYDRESDLYALFVTITELAGARYRTSLVKSKDLLADLENPNLEGLFAKMNFDNATKRMLKDLIKRMLCSDRTQRATAEDALNGFKEAFRIVQSKNKATPVATVQPAESKLFTAKDIKFWVEMDLNKSILELISVGQSKETTLKRWIESYRKLRTSVSDDEYEQFSMMYYNNELKILSRYIFDFLRFNLIECDDNAATRLLLRHYQIIKPLKQFPLIGEWKARFSRWNNIIPLQISASSAQFCTDLATFKRSVYVILHLEISEQTPKLLIALRDALSSQLALPFPEWCSQLPVLIRLFNQQYYCVTQIDELVIKCDEILNLKEGFCDDLDEWIENVSTAAIAGDFPPDLPGYFALPNLLVDQLIIYVSQREKISDFLNLSPGLHATYTLKIIDDLITAMRMSDHQSMVNLSQKLSMLGLLMGTYNFLYHTPSAYVTTQEKNKRLFVALTNQPLSDNELKDKLKTMRHYFSVIDKLENLGKAARFYPYISLALDELISDSAHAISLVAITANGLDVSNFVLLENVLKRLLNQPSGEQLNNKLLAEFTQYFANPGKYQVPMLPSARVANHPNSTFTHKSSSDTEQELQFELEMDAPPTIANK